MNRFILFLLLVTPLLTIAQPEMFMAIEGSSQGLISSSVNDDLSYPNEIKILAMEQSLRVPFDPTNGRASGNTEAGVLKIKKYVNMASPLLAAALANNESLELTLRFYRQSQSGQGAENYYTITLENARLVLFRPLATDITTTSEPALGHFEELSFFYERIIYQYEPSGPSSTFEISGN